MGCGSSTSVVKITKDVSSQKASAISEQAPDIEVTKSLTTHSEREVPDGAEDSVQSDCEATAAENSLVDEDNAVPNETNSTDGSDTHSNAHKDPTEPQNIENPGKSEDVVTVVSITTSNSNHQSEAELNIEPATKENLQYLEIASSPTSLSTKSAESQLSLNKKRKVSFAEIDKYCGQSGEEQNNTNIKSEKINNNKDDRGTENKNTEEHHFSENKKTEKENNDSKNKNTEDENYSLLKEKSVIQVNRGLLEGQKENTVDIIEGKDCNSACSDYTDNSSGLDVDVAENILSNLIVNDVMSSLTMPQEGSNSEQQLDQHEMGERTKVVKEVVGDDVVVTKKDAESVGKEIELPHVGVVGPGVIVPSSGLSPASKPAFQYIETDEDILLHSALRLTCDITDKQQLVDLAAKANALYLESSLPTIAEVASSMPALRKLDIGGNHSGPVSVRAILSILTSHDCVEHLDISDNSADSECADHLSKLISSSKSLRWLNVSSNNFGKESLNRCLSVSVLASTSLTYLDVSGCGSMNFHGLFEAMRQGYSNCTLPLSYLDISSNHLNDGQQLGIDLSLVLENPNCCLRTLHLNSTGLTSAGCEAMTAGLQANTSLAVLNIGGYENSASDLSALVKMIAAAKNLNKLSIGGVKVDSETILGDEVLPLLNITDLDVGNCGFVDEVFVKLAKSSPGRLGRLESLNLSGNAELTSAGIEAVDKLCSIDGFSNLMKINLSLMEVDHLPETLNSCFKNVTHLNIRKSRISQAALASLNTIPQKLEHLVLDGIKLSNLGALASIMEVNSKHQFQTLSLGNCGLTDTDFKPFSQFLGHVSSPIKTLTNLDLSSNRLTDEALITLSDQLKKMPNHPLKSLDISNNVCTDLAANALSSLIMSASSKSNIQYLSVASNQLTSNGIKSLTSAVITGSSRRGLISLDISNQKSSLDDDEADEVITNLATTIGIDTDRSDEVIPGLPVNLNVNLTGLDGASNAKVKALNSSSIKTDFSKVCRGSASLNDYLLLGAGLEKKLGIHNTEKMCISFASSEWVSIIGSDAPAWLKVETERAKGVYINHLPGTATVQRLEGMLEMDADCQVSDVYIVKDPIMRKPTGAAWVLLDSESCVQKVLDWCHDGEAVMYGSPFSVSPLPVSILDEQQGAQVLAKRDLALREKQRKETELDDLKVLEESQKLADERAAYREAHPAYQGGRIW